MARTLVVSDLHLGTPSRRDVLRLPEPRAKLLQSLEQVQRLVLLGDVIELRYGPVGAAIDAARPVLGEIAAALPRGAEVVIVPGNHDHHLLAHWLERRAGAGAGVRAGGAGADAGGAGAGGGAGPPLALETAVEPRAGDPLAAVVAALNGVEVRVAYPGVWLRDDVYATHGHYADRHTTVPMLERLAAGTMARILAQDAGAPLAIEDYEAVLAPVYAWIHALAQATGGEHGARGSRGASAGAWRLLAGPPAGRGLRRWRRRGLAAAFPMLIWSLNRVGIGPLRPQLSAGELRRSSLRAMREVLARLRIDAPHVIFGHTHRAGPRPRDDPDEWQRRGQRLVNAGCWVLEPHFLGPRPQESPYRAGFAVRVDDDAAPALTNLLDPPAGRAPG